MSYSRELAHYIVENNSDVEALYASLESFGLLSLLPQITIEVKAIRAKLLENEKIEIESPFALNDAAVARIKRIVGNDIAAYDVIINPKLLAGFKARFKGKLYDGSAERIVRQLLQERS
jgi:F0F1-type ATP synthase delta subunit